MTSGLSSRGEIIDFLYFADTHEDTEHFEVMTELLDWQIRKEKFIPDNKLYNGKLMNFKKYHGIASDSIENKKGKSNCYTFIVEEKKWNVDFL